MPSQCARRGLLPNLYTVIKTSQNTGWKCFWCVFFEQTSNSRSLAPSVSSFWVPHFKISVNHPCHFVCFLLLLTGLQTGVQISPWNFELVLMSHACRWTWWNEGSSSHQVPNHTLSLNTILELEMAQMKLLLRQFCLSFWILTASRQYWSNEL